jgi:hypothetical protein
VRLPDAVVIVASNGIARFSRRCGANRWCSPTIAPDHPVLGIVGTVQDGPPNYEVAKEFSVKWIEGSEGTTFVAGHCFAAVSRSKRPVLRIAAPNPDDAITIRDEYGYRLIAIMDVKRGGYGSQKISEQEFRRSETCDKAVKASWPNAGGASWKR